MLLIPFLPLEEISFTNNLFRFGSNFSDIQMEEFLILIKFGNFSEQDVYYMPVWKRKKYLSILEKWYVKKDE